MTRQGRSCDRMAALIVLSTLATQYGCSEAFVMKGAPSSSIRSSSGSTQLGMATKTQEKFPGPPPVALPDISNFLKEDEEDDTEELKSRADAIQEEMDSGTRQYPEWVTEDYGESALNDPFGLDDDDDPDALDPNELGQWSKADVQDKFDYEWDPLNSKTPDPNLLDPNVKHVTQPEMDDDGVEVGYDPIFGPSNPIDTRTIVEAPDSYMVAEETRDDAMVPRIFPKDDLELDFNKDITEFRKSLGIIETYVDPWLKMEVPKNVARWHGYPEDEKFPAKPYTNNRFTKPEDRTPFETFTKHKARKIAVQLARAKNNEWLPDGTSQAYLSKTTESFLKYKTLVGTTQKGDCDEALVQTMQPALKVLGSVVDLLETIVNDDGNIVLRFHYHGLIKNKAGMAAWAEVLLREECGLDNVTGIIFEAGTRKRDPYYDGGDHWCGPY